MELNQDTVRQMQRKAWDDRRELECTGPREFGVVDSVTQRGVVVRWERGPFSQSLEYGRVKLSKLGENLELRGWHDIPRELKIQDVFASVREWVPRRDGPVWRVPMPLPVPYEISTEPQNVMLEMDVLEFRLEDDGRVTCEGVVVQAPQRR